MTRPILAVRHAEVGGQLVDVISARGVITDVAPTIRKGADLEIDAAGGALLPGLHDHHIHLLALAAARASLAVGPTDTPTPDAFDERLRAAAGAADDSGWLRAVGYHEFHAGPLDRGRLDALVPHRPVRIQHATGALWVLNSAAIDRSGIDALELDGIERDSNGRPTGRLYGLDRLLRERVPPTPLDLPALGRELASYGVTGVTDLTPTDRADDIDLLARHAATPDFPITVTVTGGLHLPADAGPKLPRGPVKLLVADHALPTILDVADLIEQAHGRGRTVAIHCASRVALVLALAAWEDASARPGDRIEHGSVIPVELLPHLAELGLTVVTQPTFVADRGDRYLHDVPVAEHPDLWRCGSLLRGGVPLAAGTDAPYGDADPWRAVRAASERTTASGHLFGPSERIDPRSALAMFLTPAEQPAGPQRAVAPGAEARLCLLDRPLHEALRQPTSTNVRATITAEGVFTT